MSIHLLRVNMSQVVSGVIGGSLKLKNGLTFSKPPKRKKRKKEKKRKKDKDKKSKKKDKKSKRKRLKFETGDIDIGDDNTSATAEAEPADSSTEQTSETETTKATESEPNAGYDPLQDPTLTASQKRHIEAQRKRFVGDDCHWLASSRC